MIRIYLKDSKFGENKNQLKTCKKKEEKMFKPRNFSEKCWTLGPNKVRIMVKVLDNKSIIV